MAQSATTVFPPNPSPPTNLSSTGSQPPNPATFDLTTAGPYFSATGDQHYPRANLAPYFDDGILVGTTFTLNEGGGARNAFATNTAALANGTSVANEGAGDNNSTALATGSRAECPTQVFSCGPLATAATRAAGPNASHASTMSPATLPTLASISTPSSASGAGTVTQTLTGTGFTPQCRIYVNGVEQATTFTNSTTMSATITKKSSAGTWPVVVYLGGTPVTAAVTWTFT